MYYYSTVDGIVMTHGALETDEYSMPCVRVHFERPNDHNGFDFADGRIPHYNFQKAFGFSEDELFKLREYMRDNAFLLWNSRKRAVVKMPKVLQDFLGQRDVASR